MVRQGGFAMLIPEPWSDTRPNPDWQIVGVPWQQGLAWLDVTSPGARASPAAGRIARTDADPLSEAIARRVTLAARSTPKAGSVRRPPRRRGFGGTPPALASRSARLRATR